MDSLFIHGRTALDDAHELIELYGETAMFEAAARARQSRSAGNVTRCCHWRQIERVVAVLASEEITGSIH